MTRHRSRTIPPSREVFCAGLCALVTSRHLEGEERWAPLFLVGGREFRTSANSFESAFYLGPVLFVMADQMTAAKRPVSEEAIALRTLRMTSAVTDGRYDDCSS